MINFYKFIYEFGYAAKSLFFKTVLVPIFMSTQYNYNCDKVIINNSNLDLSAFSKTTIISGDSIFLKSMASALSKLSHGKAPNKTIIIISDKKITRDKDLIRLCRKLKGSVEIESFSLNEFDDELDEISNDYRIFTNKLPLTLRHLRESQK